MNCPICQATLNITGPKTSWCPVCRRTLRNEQAENLERVHSKIAKEIIGYVVRRSSSPWQLGREFRADHLREYVMERHPNIAPDSPGRILRQLRQQGKLNYRVVSRSQSLYEALPVDAA